MVLGGVCVVTRYAAQNHTCSGVLVACITVSAVIDGSRWHLRHLRTADLFSNTSGSPFQPQNRHPKPSAHRTARRNAAAAPADGNICCIASSVVGKSKREIIWHNTTYSSLGCQPDRHALNYRGARKLLKRKGVRPAVRRGSGSGGGALRRPRFPRGVPAPLRQSSRK